jgi:peroxin-10
MEDSPVIADAARMAGSSAMLEGGVEVSLDPNAYSTNNELLIESGPLHLTSSSIEKAINTPVLTEPRYRLNDKQLMGWIKGQQQRKCTLCLEELKDPAATQCGHVFCWTCIGDWLREKQECPLCRKAALVQHMLPLRS